MAPAGPKIDEMLMMEPPLKLPFLSDDQVAWRGRVPARRAGGILPEGVEKLYFVGLIAPRGPQIPIYGAQTKLIVRMIRLYEEAGCHGLALSNYFASCRSPNTASTLCDLPGSSRWPTPNGCWQRLRQRPWHGRHPSAPGSRPDGRVARREWVNAVLTAQSGPTVTRRVTVCRASP